MNKRTADLLFEARMLKDLNRSGYAFLGNGRESIAEHCFTMAFICWVMGRTVSGIDPEKLIAMALVHDLAEARTGDFNYVQKKYAQVDEANAWPIWREICLLARTLWSWWRNSMLVKPGKPGWQKMRISCRSSWN